MASPPSLSRPCGTAPRLGSPTGRPTTSTLTGEAVDQFVDELASRAERVTTDSHWGAEVRRQAANLLDSWRGRRTHLPTGVLGYRDADGVTGLLCDPSDGAWDTWSVPFSLREVEAEVLLQIEGVDPSLTEAPAWEYVDETEEGT